MSTCNKKICFQCKIKPVASGNRKLYCDNCFVTVRNSKRNKVDIMKPIIEETDNLKHVIKEVVKEAVKEIINYQSMSQQYIPHMIEDILPKSYLESVCNTQQERIKQLESENTYYKHLTQYIQTADYNGYYNGYNNAYDGYDEYGNYVNYGNYGNYGNYVNS